MRYRDPDSVFQISSSPGCLPGSFPPPRTWPMVPGDGTQNGRSIAITSTAGHRSQPRGIDPAREATVRRDALWFALRTACHAISAVWLGNPGSDDVLRGCAELVALRPDVDRICMRVRVSPR